MLSSQLPSLHHSLVTSFTPFTRHLSLLSSACSHHSHRQLSPSGPPPVLPLIICLSSALVTSTISSLFSGHLLLLFHPSTVSHLNSRLHQSQHLFITPLATSSRPFTRHLSLLSPASSHYSHRQLIIPWPPPLRPPLVMCLSSHYHALITAITSSSFSEHILSASHSSSVSPLTSMLSSQPSPAHHLQATSTPPSTHHMSLISLSRSVHSHYQLIILWAYSLILSLVICLSSHQLALIIANTSSSFPGTSRPFLILICLSSHLHALITTTVSSCHHFQAISFLPFTRHLSIISLSCSHHSHHEPLMPLGTSSPPFTRLWCRGPVGIHHHPPPATRRRSDTPPTSLTSSLYAEPPFLPPPIACLAIPLSLLALAPGSLPQP